MAATCPSCQAEAVVTQERDNGPHTFCNHCGAEPLRSESVDPAGAWLTRAHKAREAAEIEQTLASLLLLAQMAREEFPTAKGIQLGDSDQGPYYVIEGVLDADGEDLDEDGEFDGNTGYVGALDDRVFDTFAPFCMGEDMAYIHKRQGITDAVLDIDAILEGIKVPEEGGLT